MLKTLKKSVDQLRHTFRKVAARTQSEDQLIKNIKEFMGKKFDYKPEDLQVTIKRTVYYQLGKRHDGKEIRIKLPEHRTDYARVQNMAQEAVRQFRTTKAHSVVLENGPAPVRKPEEKPAPAAGEAEQPKPA